VRLELGWRDVDRAVPAWRKLQLQRHCEVLGFDELSVQEKQ
jgi:hypothetical protein